MVTGNEIVRESSQIFMKSSSELSLSSGRELWGTFGKSLSVTFYITNTLDRTSTFALQARNIMEYPVALGKTT